VIFIVSNWAIKTTQGVKASKGVKEEHRALKEIFGE